VSFQRHSGPRIYHGIIAEIDARVTKVRAATVGYFRSGDVFSFRIMGLEADYVFNACLAETSSAPSRHIVYADTGAVTSQDGFRDYRFDIAGQMKRVASSGDARFLRMDIKVCLEGGISTAMQDISMNGMGLISPTPLKEGTVVTFMIDSAVGHVEGKAEVRYCREIASVPVTYRVGMQLLPFDRLNGARWRQLLLRR
jgi:hypothetical protein